MSWIGEVVSELLDKYKKEKEEQSTEPKQESYAQVAARLEEKYPTKQTTQLSPQENYAQIAARLEKEYSPEKNAARTQAVSDWGNRYNSVIQGVLDSSKQGNTGNAKGSMDGYIAEIDSLISDYESIREYADRFGMVNSPRYVQQLKDLKTNLNAIYHPVGAVNAGLTAADRAKSTMINNQAARYKADHAALVEDILAGRASFADHGQILTRDEQNDLMARMQDMGIMPTYESSSEAENSAALSERVLDHYREMYDAGWRPPKYNDGSFGDALKASWGITWSTVKAGLGEFSKGIMTSLDVTAGDGLQALGWKNNPISKLADQVDAEYAAIKKEQAQAIYDAGFKQGDKFVNITTNILEQSIASTPHLILALYTGGASAGPSAASLMTNAVAQTASKATLARMAVTQMLKNPQFQLSLARSLGTDYEEAKADGAGDTAAGFYAVITSFLNAGIEIGLTGESGIQGIPQSGGKPLLDWITSSLEEGGEEILQGVVSDALAKVIYDEDREVLDAHKMLKEGAMGTAVGAAMGGGQIVSQNAISKLQSANGTTVQDSTVEQAAPSAEEKWQNNLREAVLTVMNGGKKDTAQTPTNQKNTAPDGTAQDAAVNQSQATGKPHISMEEFANSESPVWKNVEYSDDATKASIMQQTHNDMLAEGAVVTVSDTVADNVEQSFPDLRSMKKAERAPILKNAMTKLKNNLRQFLNGFKNQGFEFEVNGKVLDATLYNTGINEVLEKITKEKASMLYSTAEIFQNARYLYSTPDYDGDPNVYRWNYFYTPVQIGEDVVGVRIAVRDLATPRESQIYNWGIKKDASLDGGSHGHKAASSGVSSDAPTDTSLDGVGRGAESRISHGASSDVSNNTIPQPGENVNGNSLQPSDTRRGKVKRSKVFDNTYANAIGEGTKRVGKIAQQTDPHIAEYTPVSEKESVYNALLRGGERVESGNDSADYRVSPSKVMEEYSYLLEKDGWTGEDNDTAMLVLNYLQKQGDADRITALARKQRTEGNRGGGFVQSFAKYSRTPAKAMAEAVSELDSYTESDVVKRFYRKKNFEAWKKSVSKDIIKLASEIENMSSDNVDGMRGIVRQLANLRRTTAWAGRSSKLTRIADKIVDKLDFETAKDIAVKQLSMIPNDFKKRPIGQIVKTIRIQNMLSALTTVNRNLVGNTSIGMMDALADSTVGVAFDALMAKVTGKRTVAGDIKYGKTYFQGAVEAAQMAALCTELDIPMELDTKYNTGTRNFSPKSCGVVRFMSAYEKYLKYALEVSDTFFAGGTSAAVNSSLRSLGKNANLSNAEIDALSQKTGQRRTFKEGRKLAQGTTKVKEGLNKLGTENIGVGDFAISFAAIPGEVAQVGIDYSTGGLLGFAEMLKVIKDVKSGKEIDVLAQRKAVTDAARGLTGAGVIALFTALALKGIIGVHDDEDYDKRSLEQSVGLSGAQFNISAALRALTGGSAEWKKTDIKIGIDFLEPFNAQMYIGYLMSQEDDVKSMLQEYPGASVSGIASSVMDLPMMQGIADLQEIVKSISEEKYDDAAGKAIGSTASSFIPAWVRQSAQFIDKNYRDTSGKDALEKATNQVIASIPFASKNLPKKYNALGEEQLRYKNPVLGFFNTFLSPGDIETGTTDDRAYMITEYLGELSNATGTASFYPDSKVPNSITVYGEKIALRGTKNADTYQKTYGENIAALYGNLIDDADFEIFSDELNIKAFDKAKEYAKEFAMASVSDYRDVQSGTSAEIAKDIITDCVIFSMDDALSDLTKAWKYGRDATEAVEAVEAAYSLYEDLSSRQLRAVIQKSTGRVEACHAAMAEDMDAQTFAKLYQTYYEISGSDSKPTQKANSWAAQLQKAKEKGLITNKQMQVMKEFLAFSDGHTIETDKFDQLASSGLSADKSSYVMDIIANLKPSPGRSTVSDVQEAEALAKSNLSEKDKQAAMMLYLSDSQDENLKQMVDKGYSADDYAHVYRIYYDEEQKGGKGTKARTIAGIQKILGCSYSTAEAVYKIYEK